VANLKVLGVIPARYGSTRFPGKPLVSLQGKPLIQWVVESAKKSRKLSKLVVATDDERIREAVEAIGTEVVMTDPELPSGTDRVYAAGRTFDADVIVNVQGDEPLINPEHIDLLISAFEGREKPEMATLAHPLSEEDLKSPHAVKVVMDGFGHALYFSRFAIPYSRVSAKELQGGALKHIGMYAYQHEFLTKFCETEPAVLEKAEALEQLRALYMGAKIRVLKVEAAHPGVDTPEDLEKISQILKSRRMP
jgi:3-deoxy-manno-octulosonate cytidylyltransferase (CMP-KDO synthetase)